MNVGTTDRALLLADRTAVLFLGIAAGVAIGYAFGHGGGQPPLHPVVLPPPLLPSPGVTAANGPVRQGQVPITPPQGAAARDLDLAFPFQRHLLETVAAGRPITVGVFGDSFGDGVWSALYRLLPAREQYRVLKLSQQSTGFTRYASLNLEQHAEQQLADKGPVDIAVISFGANDTQGVYAGGHAAALMSPAWQQVIGDRVDAFVALMRARGAMVYWVGLPKMRSDSFDADIAAMNQFYTARMRALRVPFIDVRPLTIDAAGAYAAYLADPVSHEQRLMRANDGIHMSMNGYVVITRDLAARIKAYVAAARAAASGPGAVLTIASAPAAAPPPPPRLPEPTVPKETPAKSADNGQAERPDKQAGNDRDKPKDQDKVKEQAKAKDEPATKDQAKPKDQDKPKDQPRPTEHIDAADAPAPEPDKTLDEIMNEVRTPKPAKAAAKAPRRPAARDDVKGNEADVPGNHQ